MEEIDGPGGGSCWEGGSYGPDGDGSRDADLDEGGGGGAEGGGGGGEPQAGKKPLSASERAAELAKILYKSGMKANLELYGMLSEAGLSGNAYDRLISWLLVEENFAALQTAVQSKTLYKADTVRGKINRALELDGCPAHVHGKGLVAGAKPATFFLKSGTGDEAATVEYSACVLDTGYQLAHHLLHPAAASPPLNSPPTGHIFSGAGSAVDNFCNSPAGEEYNKWLQAHWAARTPSGDGWASALHGKVEEQFPGRRHTFIPILAGLFGDALAVSEQLHAGLFQMRIKLGSFHPALAHLASLCLLAGLCEKPVLGDKATPEATSNFNDLYAQIFAQLGWPHFFDTNYVALPWEKLSHLNIPGQPGDICVFKLCLFALMLDNGEARTLFGTQNCLLCTGIGPKPAEPHPIFTAPPGVCPCCQATHKPRCAVVPLGYVVEGEGVAEGTKVVREVSAGVYEVSVAQDLPPRALSGGFFGSIVGNTLTLFSNPHSFEDALKLYEAKTALRAAIGVTAAGGGEVGALEAKVGAVNAALRRHGFNADRTVTAFSGSLLPPAQLPFFSWGGGVRALCCNPMLTVLFELLHTLQLGLHKLLLSIVLLTVSRSRGVERDGSVKSAGNDAFRLLDGIIRRIRSFTDGVREQRAVWGDGVSRKGSSFFTGRAYSSLLAPLLACMTPSVIPERRDRRQLIFLLEHAAWFFTIARNPSRFYGGLDSYAALLGRVATTINDALISTFSGRGFKAGGEDDMETFKLHQLNVDHLLFYVTKFGPLWDYSCSAMEAAGRPLKELYFSTNRHARDWTLQLAKRFMEGFFLRSVAPRFYGVAPVAAPADDPLLNVNRLDKRALPPPSAARLEEAWGTFMATRAPTDFVDSSPGTELPDFFCDGKVVRRLPWRGVCDRNVFDGEVWQLYNLDGNGHHQVGRTHHESVLVRVEDAPLVKPLAVFTRGGVPFVLAHPYKPHEVDTPRSEEFMLYKPRVLDSLTFVVVPLCELCRPLFPLPYFDEAAPAPAAPVPQARDVQPAANTVLVSTYIDWLG